MTTNFSVNLWGSNPMNDNDDCWTGLDFKTEEEALKCYNNVEDHFEDYDLEGTRYVEVVSNTTKSDLRDVREVSGYTTTSDAPDWEREMAMEAGMMGGLDSYNDYYGY